MNQYCQDAFDCAPEHGLPPEEIHQGYQGLGAASNEAITRLPATAMNTESSYSSRLRERLKARLEAELTADGAEFEPDAVRSLLEPGA